MVESEERLAELEAAWDDPVQAAARPLSSPAWLLAWWHHAAPADRKLRVVIVHEAGKVVAVAPFVVRPGPAGLAQYGLLGAGVGHRLAPVAARGREVGPAVAAALAGATPRPTSVRLEATDADPEWASALRDHWPRRPRPWLREDGVLSAPVVTVQGRGYDEWLAGKSRNFRDQVRRGRRRLERRGGIVRLARTAEEGQRDVRALVRMHYSRWDERGGSGALNAGVEAMLQEAAGRLVPSGRMRLWTVEIDGKPVGSQLCLSAGSETAFWNGGFDASASDLKPGFHGLAAAIEDAFERGAHRFDLGGGAHPYKLRFADRDAPIAWRTLYPRNARYPLTRIQALPRHTRDRARGAARRLDPDTRRRLKRLLRR